MALDLRQLALQYHRASPAGKLAIVATKPMTTQHDLSLAYSPGVAAACEEIAADPMNAALYTARANLVAVVSNGTAILGLGDLGPLAAKPVMEGKAVLFKKFAGIDVFDIEIAEKDPARLIEIVASLEPTFGGINLEDIKGPECFEVETRLKERMKIPVFHDDQHGTAIVVAAAVTNTLLLVKKRIEDVRLVTVGAGAAGIACLNLLVAMGLPRENIWLYDRSGLVRAGRNDETNPYKAAYARADGALSLTDALAGADILLGLSGPKTITADMVKGMGPSPLVLALANPEPEIRPELVKAVRPDAIMATGRSDYPNQVNNVLCFPFMFRGALDVGATAINEAMKVACVEALALLARAEPSDEVAAAYQNTELSFGPDYILPKPFDPRLIVQIAPAVARAAMASGVATRPIADFAGYREQLASYVFRSGTVMKPVMDKAKQAPQRVVFAEGEDERVLRAAQTVVDEGIARPIVLGRRGAVEERIARLGLRLVPGRDIEIIEIIRDLRYHSYAEAYHRLMRRRGVTPEHASEVVRSSTTVFGALMVRRGDADAMICGTTGRYASHFERVVQVVGQQPGVTVAAAMGVLILAKGTFFFCDTYVNPDPDAEELAAITLMAAAAVRRFGIEPKVALLSHSDFGSADTPSALKMRKVLELVTARAPTLEIDGEMHADAALSQEIRDRVCPDSRLRGVANLLVMPTLDAANITFNALKVLGDGINVGPILLGVDAPIHLATPSVTVRGLLNLTAIAVVEAQLRAAESPRRGAEAAD